MAYAPFWFASFNSPYKEFRVIKQNTKNWEKAYELLDEHRSDKMFLCAEMSYDAIENGVENYDYGDQEFIVPMPKNYDNLKKKCRVFGLLETHYAAHMERQQRIIKDAQNKEFSIIATSDLINFNQGKNYEIFMKAVEENYAPIERLFLRCGWDTEKEITFWTPKSDL